MHTTEEEEKGLVILKEPLHESVPLSIQPIVTSRGLLVGVRLHRLETGPE